MNEFQALGPISDDGCVALWLRFFAPNINVLTYLLISINTKRNNENSDGQTQAPTAVAGKSKSDNKIRKNI